MPLEYPVTISSVECDDSIVLGRPGPGCTHDWPTISIAIEEIEKTFSIAVANPATGDLIRRMWEREIVDGKTAECQLFIGSQPGFSGRLIDASTETQWLSYDYAPMTVVKRALRWTYASQCAGTKLMPLHGAIIKTHGNLCCITGCRAAGKTYLTDALLQFSEDSQMVIDDWSLVDTLTGTIIPTGDSYLHVRGSSLSRGSRQIDGGDPLLVELCDNNLWAEETRYLMRKNTLRHFSSYAKGGLDMIIFVSEPLADVFSITSDLSIVERQLAAEIGHFWDDSNISLPASTVKMMAANWKKLLDRTRHIVLRGHRSVPVDRVAEELMLHFRR